MESPRFQVVTTETERKTKMTAKRRCCITAVSLCLIAILTAVTIPVVMYISDNYVVKIPELWENVAEYRVDCHPDPGKSQAKCELRGCLWLPGVEPGGVHCTFPSAHGYRVEREDSWTSSGGGVFLKKLGNVSLFGKETIDVKLEVTYISRTIVRLKFFDPNVIRHQVPDDPPVIPDRDFGNKSYVVVYRRKPQFGVIVRRNHTHPDDIWAKPGKYELPVVFDSSNPGFVFSDQFLQMSTRLPSMNVYGVGDARNQHLNQDLQWRTWGVWARESERETVPGTHPFLMSLGHNGEASGIYLRNSHAVEMVLQPHPAVTFRALGGILDFFIFLGPTPEDVVKQYTRIVGRPMLPPYWALGLHYGRQIFNDSSLTDAVKRMSDSLIPFDAIHLGREVLNRYNGFTYDDITFPGLTDLVERIHKEQARRVTVTTWPAVSSRPPTDPYFPLEEAKRSRILIGGSTPLVGKMLSGDVFYPDFSHPNASNYWWNISLDFHSRLPFDSVHLEYNSPLNYVDGSMQSCARNLINYPPYRPQSVFEFSPLKPLFSNTLCLDAKQQAGLHYEIHNLYALHHAKSAYTGFSRAFSLRRPFILTASHAPGIGRYAAHLITNTADKWEHMRRSIIGVLELNMLGLPAVGSDICGHRGNATRELCRRWIQLGAFYPIARIFKAGHDQDQDPAAMGGEVLEAGRVAFGTRYQLLPYLYTLFYLASTDGGTVARPLFHEFPHNNKTRGIEDQFLWGAALLISPVLQPDNIITSLYLPKGRWFDYYTGEEVKRNNAGLSLPRNKDKISLHVRGGYVIPIHLKLNTTTTNRHPLGLIVALNENNTAQGFLYMDDKESIIHETPFQKGTLLNFRVEKDELKVNLPLNGYNNPDDIVIASVTFWGVPKEPRVVLVNGRVWPRSHCTYEFKSKIFDVTELGFRINARDNAIRLRYS